MLEGTPICVCRFSFCRYSVGEGGQLVCGSVCSVFVLIGWLFFPEG